MTAVWKPRHKTHQVEISHAGHTVMLGASAPILVQSMTNTPTEDVEATVRQCLALAKSGSELIRLTVNTPAAAIAVAKIREQLDAQDCFVPLVGDFHYNGHKLLTDYPECARALSKYRINPGNVGKGDRHDENFAAMIRLAIDHDKAVRIGVNGGSIDKELFQKMIDANVAEGSPKDPHDVMLEALVESTVQSAQAAERLGLASNKIVLSAKVSDVRDLVVVYRKLAVRGQWALHLGLTEAGIGSKGIVASSAALSALLADGIGDTIRVSITPEPGQARTTEVRVAREILQSMGLRHFFPLVTSCPGCGRTSSDLFQSLAKQTQDFLNEKMYEWSTLYPGVEQMKVAVMGCVVNGPGEAQHADIGVSLPGRGEAPVAPVFADGKKIASLKGDSIAQEFQTILETYVKSRWGN